MSTMKLRDDLSATHPANIVRELLHQPGSNAVERHASSIEDRAVATLERRAPDVIRIGRKAGIDIEFLGVSRLFRDPRFYEGQDTDWVIAPSDPRSRAVAPRREGRELERFAALGLDMLLYEAHEVDQANTGELRQAAAGGRRELTVAKASELVGPVPPPVDSTALAERLAHRSTQVAHAARRTVQVAGAAAVAVVTVPAAAVGTALASAAALDPVIIGATPAYSERPGAPAGWYALAQWNW